MCLGHWFGLEKNFFRRATWSANFPARWLFLMLVLSNHLSLAQERPKVSLGASSKTLGYSPLWVGAKRGFFEHKASMSSWFSCVACP